MAGNLRGKNPRVSDQVFLVDPDEVTLVEDKNHPLYDERVHLPVDEGLVRSIDKHGVLQSILLRRNGDLLEVAIGRQRVKAAREVNRRRREDGRPAIRIMASFRRGEDKSFIEAGIAENERRRPDEILIKAAKANRALQYGSTMEEIAEEFGVVAETVENWLKLLELHPRITAAVSRGEVRYTVAMRLAKLPREKQLAKYKKLKKAGATTANAVRVVVGGKLERVCPPSKNQLRRIADKFHEAKSFLADDAASDCYSFVAFVLGRISQDELLDCLSSSAAGLLGTAVKHGMEVK